MEVALAAGCSYLPAEINEPRSLLTWPRGLSFLTIYGWRFADQDCVAFEVSMHLSSKAGPR
jgi:hypothetical protein